MEDHLANSFQGPERVNVGGGEMGLIRYKLFSVDRAERGDKARIMLHAPPAARSIDGAGRTKSG